VPGKPYCLAHCRACYVPPASPEAKRVRAEWDRYEKFTDARARAGVL
jgi:hypothetical protein